MSAKSEILKRLARFVLGNVIDERELGKIVQSITSKAARKELGLESKFGTAGTGSRAAMVFSKVKKGEGVGGLTPRELEDLTSELLPATAREVGKLSPEAGERLQQELVEEFISAETGVPDVAALPVLGRPVERVKVLSSSKPEKVSSTVLGDIRLDTDELGVTVAEDLLGLQFGKPTPALSVIGIRIGSSEARAATHEVAHAIDLLLADPIFTTSPSLRFLARGRAMASVDEMSKKLREGILKRAEAIRKEREELSKIKDPNEIAQRSAKISGMMLDLQKYLKAQRTYVDSPREVLARAFETAMKDPKAVWKTMPRFARDIVKAAERMRNLTQMEEQALGSDLSKEVREIGKIILRVLDPRAVVLILLAGERLKDAEREIREIEETF